MGSPGPCSLPILCTTSILCVWGVLERGLPTYHLQMGLLLAGKWHPTLKWYWATFHCLGAGWGFGCRAWSLCAGALG